MKAIESVAKSGEVFNSLTDSLPVVDGESTYKGSRRPCVNEYHRDVPRAKFLEQRLFDAEGHHGHTFNVTFQHAADAGCHPREVVVC